MTDDNKEIELVDGIVNIIRERLPKCPHNLAIVWIFVFGLPLGFCPICAN